MTDADLLLDALQSERDDYAARIARALAVCDEADDWERDEQGIVTTDAIRTALAGQTRSQG